MDVASTQSVPYIDPFTEYVKTLSRYSSVTNNQLGLNPTTLYATFDDPGRVWERTSEAYVVEVDGERYFHSGLQRAEGAINWGFWDHVRYTGQTGVDIDHAVSAYESYREYIQNNFTGEERDENMAKLHELTAQAIKNITEGYADGFGGMLEEWGIKGEKSVIKESILAWFNESLSAKSGVSLANFGISVPENESGNLYTKDDIFALNFMGMALGGGVSTFSSHLAGGMDVSGFNHPFTREDYPAVFISSAIKMELLYTVFSVSDSLRDKFETAFYNNINRDVDRLNNGYVEFRERLYAYGTGSREGFEELLAKTAPIDKEPILQVAKSALESLRSGVSAMDVITKAGYFDTFFKKSDNKDDFDKSLGYSTGVRTLVDDINWFFSQMGIARQRIENIDWTITNCWSTFG